MRIPTAAQQLAALVQEGDGQALELERSTGELKEGMQRLCAFLNSSGGTESTLEVLQSQGMSGQARCCVVYEEAHSLIPRWNAVASDGDKTASNGTAKAILQGRTFGLGCLLITQRTANLTKSILNQCNTLFGLRVFDATGMEFLKNSIGEDYAGILSTLEDRHAVVFGRASSSRNPLPTRLNDRADFIREFREPKPPSAGTGTKT